MTPSQKECYRLLKKYNFPEKKYRHVELVAGVAKFLAGKLKVQNPKLKADENLLEAAGLLHDIDKGINGAGETHPKTGVKILRQEGYEDIADLVAKHSLPAILDEESRPKSWEEKILYLADKMVKNEIIGVDERFRLWGKEDIPEFNELLEKTYSEVKQLERDIFEKVEMTPGEFKGEYFG